MKIREEEKRREEEEGTVEEVEEEEDRGRDENSLSVGCFRVMNPHLTAVTPLFDIPPRAMMGYLTGCISRPSFLRSSSSPICVRQFSRVPLLCPFPLATFKIMIIPTVFTRVFPSERIAAFTWMHPPIFLHFFSDHNRVVSSLSLRPAIPLHRL